MKNLDNYSNNTTIYTRTGSTQTVVLGWRGMTVAWFCITVIEDGKLKVLAAGDIPQWCEEDADAFTWLVNSGLVDEGDFEDEDGNDFWVGIVDERGFLLTPIKPRPL
ncbi:MAG: hypothetical protein KGL42_08840 [Betaproteobacteria bacterium]|nr:hypothetical protein [Betaproteobacteria bacterium]